MTQATRSAASFLLLAALSGCAPLGMFRPASGFLENRSYELGLGATAVSPRPYVDERWLHAGQMWLTGRATPWLHLSGIAAFDAEAAAAGGGVRALFLRTNRFNLGVDTEIGYGWGAFGLPFATRLFEQHWLYCSPRLSNFGIEPAFALPIGLNVHLPGSGFLRFEYQSNWVAFSAYNQRHHLGAALAVQW